MKPSVDINQKKDKFFTIYNLLAIFCSLALLIVTNSAQAASGITYHGKIIKPDGVTPVTSNQTVFRIQVRSPGNNCLLWEEQQTKDLSSSNGVFTVTIADTDELSLVANALPFSLERVFSNRTSFSALTGCTAGTVYNPSPTDGRSLVVYFKENPADLTWEQMPITKMNFVPLALNSLQLEGYSASEFLKIDPLSSYTTLTAANVNTLVDIIAGTNNQYLRPATTFSGDVTGTYNATVVERIRGRNVVATAPTTGQVLKFDGTNWAPAADDVGSAIGDASYAAKGVVQVLTDQATSGLTVASGVLSMPAVGTAGTYGSSILIPIITTDAKGRVTTVTTAAPDDVTKLPLLGGTMQGSIDMGGFNITNATSLASTNVSTRNVILSDNDTNTVTIRTPTDITANYVLQLPANDGTASGQVLSTDGSGVLSWVAPNSSLGLTGDRAVITNGTGTALTNFTCSVGQVMGFNGSGVPVCTDVTGAGGFVQNGNSYGANAVLGTNDNFTLGFETNGTTKMTILANGNVGIGTASPSTALEIDSGTSSGTMNVRNSSSAASSMIQATNSGGLTVSLISHGSTAAGTTAGIPNTRLGVLNSQTVDGLLINSTAGIRIASSSVERIHINPTGNVGIGTTSPNTILDVNGAISQRGMAAPTVSPAGEGRIYFDSTSNKFQVSQNGGAYTDLVSAGGGGDIANGGNTFGAAATIGTNDNFGLNFETNGTTKMSILNNGRVGIGTASPVGILDVAPAAAAAATNGLGIYLSAQNATSGNTDGGSIVMTPGWHSGSGSPGVVWLGDSDGIETLASTSAGQIVVRGLNENAASLVVMGSPNNITGELIRLQNRNGVYLGNFDVNGGMSLSGIVAGGLIHGVTESTTGNTSLEAFRLSHEDTNSGGANGIGAHINFNLETATDGTFSDAARIEGVLDDATNNSKDGSLRFYTIGPNAVSGTTAPTEKVRIDSAGQLGVGVTPTSLLDLNGAVTQRGMSAPAVSSAGQGRIYFDSTSNKFRVSENNGAYVDLVGAGGGGDITNGGNTFGAAATIGTNDNFGLNFETNGSTGMTLTSAGNLAIGVGTTTSKFEVTGSSTTLPTAIVRNTATTGTTRALSVVSSNSSTDSVAIYGSTPGGYTVGVRGESLGNGAGTNGVGVEGITNGENGGSVGVYGYATSTSSSSSAAGKFVQEGGDAYGVWSEISNNSGTGAAFYATVDSANAYGMYSASGRNFFAGDVGIGTGLTAPATALDVNGAFSMRGMAAPATSVAGRGRIYYDSTSNKFRVSENNGAYTDLVPTGGVGNISNGGNSFGAAATIGTNDNFGLNFETNGSTRINISASGDVGIGTAASATEKFAVVSGGNQAAYFSSNPWSASSGTYDNTEFYTFMNPGSASTATLNGVFSLIMVDLDYNNGTARALNGTVELGSGPATMSSATGSYNRVRMNSSGTVTDAYGTNSMVTNDHATGTITNAYGIYSDVLKPGAGPLTNAYGLYIDALAGTNRWGIYQAGTSDTNFLAGNVGIGSGITAPATALDVNGAFSMRGMAAPATSVAGRGRIYYDSTSNKFRVSENNGAYTDLVSAGANAVRFPTDSTAGASIAIGTNALNNQTSSAAYNNIALGYNALGSASITTAATNNIAIGRGVLDSITSGTGNIGIGSNDGYGKYPLTAVTNGEGNVAIGNGSGGGITTGDFNTAIGNWAMLNVTTTGGNTYMGSSAGLYSVGENDTGIGLNALYDSQAGYNTAIGMSALQYTYNGTNNVGVGYAAGQNITDGNQNVTLGSGAGYAITTGSNNVAIGYDVGATTLATGSNNILIGTSIAVDTPAAGTNNHLNIGNTIYGNLSTGNVGIATNAVAWSRLWVDGNIGIVGGTGDYFIGGSPVVSDNGTAIEIGDDTDWTSVSLSPGNSEKLTVLDSGNVGIGVLGPTHPLQMASGAHVTAAGTWTNASDRRIKSNIVDSHYGLNELLQLRAVDYVMKSTGEKQVGFIAQEVQQVVPEVVSGFEGNAEQGEILGISYGNLVPILVNAIKELFVKSEVQARSIASKADATRVEILEMENEKLKQENSAIKAYLCSKDPEAVICK